MRQNLWFFLIEPDEVNSSPACGGTGSALFPLAVYFNRGIIAEAGSQFLLGELDSPSLTNDVNFYGAGVLHG